MRPAGPAERRYADALRAVRGRLERRDFERDELGLARLLVVDSPFTINMRSVSRCSRAGGIRGVEDDHLGASGRVLERREDHRLAPLRRQLLDVGDDSAHDDDLAVAASLDVRERAVGLA